MRTSNGITVYIAAPYISDPVANTLRAMALWEVLYRMGYEPFCPHLFHYMHQQHPHSEEGWLRHDMVWQERCDVVLRSIPGRSSGADREEVKANEDGQLVFHSVEELESWRRGREEEFVEKHSYVVGLAFDEDLRVVALIHKEHGPESVVGMWNGLGGTIEPGESPAEAMSREFEEESGVGIPAERWRGLGVLETERYVLHFLTTSTDDIYHCDTMEDEKVMLYSIRCLPEEIMPNMRWMIPFALDQDVEEWGRIPLVRH